MVVPDLRAIVAEYLGEQPFAVAHDLKSVRPADRMMERLMMRSPEPPRWHIIYRIYTALKDLHSHKWMYDAPSLIGHFEEAGFIEVRECGFLESRIKGIEEVEQAERVLNGAGICVEGIKPAKLL